MQGIRDEDPEDDPGLDVTAAQSRPTVPLDDIDRLSEDLATLHEAPQLWYQRVCDAFLDNADAKVLAQLDTLDIDRLRDVSNQRLGVKALRAGGVHSVGAAVRLGERGLDAIAGIGPQTVEHVLAAAGQLGRAVRESLRFRLDFTPFDELATTLVRSLDTLMTVRAICDQHSDRMAAFAAAYAERALIGKSVRKWRRLLLGRRRRDAAREAFARLCEEYRLAHAVGLADDAARVRSWETEPIPATVVWQHFRERSAQFYAVLDRIVDLGRQSPQTADGLLPEVVAAVEGQSLDTTSLRVSLRGYQEFGSKYALAQRRVVLGDEMGLGKTVQALAVIADRFAAGGTRALVVCPASVLPTWVRETGRHTHLRCVPVHGENREAAWQEWTAHGGVAIMTFSGAIAAGAPTLSVDVLVVDEAHYIKNPQAKRSMAAVSWIPSSKLVMFLTGTALENRVDELRVLVGYLRPDIAATLRAEQSAANPAGFRRAISPAYLRRNQQDVLMELPECVAVDDWVRLRPAERLAYRDVVATGEFMGVRLAAFGDLSERGAKLRRILEIVREALENGHKVVVFSYYRRVLESVAGLLGEDAVGPLDGSVPPVARQRLIDEFSAAERPHALVSQIEVGGVGLNLQAASVVVLCEPQVKPTTENQAIARVHRMGQVDTVQVHRILAENTVDERITQALIEKDRTFDIYARRSALAEETGQAVDVAEVDLAREVVAAERGRIVVDPHVLSTEDAPVE